MQSDPRPIVAHYREYFPVLSETFIQETIRSHARYRPIVLTHQPAASALDVAVVDVGGRRAALTRWFVPLRHATRAQHLKRALAEVSPAILHAHFGAEGVAAMRPSRLLGIPLIVAFYGYDATALVNQGMWRNRFKRLFSQAARILVEGPAMAERLTRLGADPARVILHRVPIHIELFPYRPPSLPATGEPIVVLQACRFVQKKGVDVTIRAFARIASAAPTAVLWLMGDGPEETDLKNLARQTGLGDRIRFLPAAPHPDYAAIMRSAHIFVHPSRTASNGDAEGGAPTALLEAQALGLPIVATTHDDIPSIVDMNAAMLAAPDDVIGFSELLLRMISSTGEWWERARAGRNHIANRHDPYLLGKRLEEIYDHVRNEPHRTEVG